VGFLRDAIRRDALLWEGAYCDAILMAMLKEDYKKAQEVQR
jgi:RimJ/RimL family protein N-acetyltransferase